MSPCTHPASSLKPDTAEQSNGTVTLKFVCVSCLTPITKQFTLGGPAPEPSRPLNYSLPIDAALRPSTA